MIEPYGMAYDDEPIEQTVSGHVEPIVSSDFDREEAYYVLRVRFDDYENKPWSENFTVDGEEDAKVKYKAIKEEYKYCSVNAHLILEKTIYLDVNFN